MASFAEACVCSALIKFFFNFTMGEGLFQFHNGAKRFFSISQWGKDFLELSLVRPMKNPLFLVYKSRYVRINVPTKRQSFSPVARQT